MGKTYRQVLYAWLAAQNRCWLNGDQGEWIQYTTKKGRESLRLEQDRWQRIEASHKERGVIPHKREIRIICATEEEQEKRVNVALNLNIRSTYGLKDQLFQEEKEEVHLFELVQQKGQWKINSFAIQRDMPAISGYNEVVGVHVNEDQVFSQASVYDRKKAVQYAEKYWNSRNPQYHYFEENDCTNFVSQVLHAGGIPMHLSSSRSRGWWYRGGNHQWSYSWSVAHAFYWYLRSDKKKGVRTILVPSARDLQLGDIICYDWKGNGRWSHNTVVTGIDANGEPLVSAHSFNSHNRNWRYEDSPAWTKNTRYAFFHVLN